jgi:hypothetical protein
MFARNLRNPRAADPELDKKSLASLGITLTSQWVPPPPAAHLFLVAE